MTTAAGPEIGRLSLLVSRQRREIELLRAQAAARSVVDMAQGMLMEQLGCGAADAARQLAALARESRTPLAELAAEIVGQQLARSLDPQSMADPGWRRVASAAGRALAAEDGDRVASAALSEALAPAGASMLCLWLIQPDGALELAGQAGLDACEAGRWWRIPPDMDCLAWRAARGTSGVFWPAGPSAPERMPTVGQRPRAARAALPLRDGPVVTGAMEACWQAPLPAFDPPLRRQLAALADLCAHALRGASAGPPPADGKPAGERQGSWLHALLDSLVESAFALHPIRGPDGDVEDFLIGYVSAGFLDPYGRGREELAGRPLLEVYPRAGRPGGLVDQATAVLAEGQPRQAVLPVVSRAGAAPGVGHVELRMAPFADGVLTAWQRLDEAERLSTLLGYVERLGRVGGFEEDLITGDIRWSEAAQALFGGGREAASPLAELPARVLGEDAAEVEHFRETLLTEKTAAAAAFRIVRADDESVRQMRVFAEPVLGQEGETIAVRGAFQDVSAYYHTHVALTATRDRLAHTEERAEEEHRLAIRLQEAITPWSPAPFATAGLDVAARYRPAGAGHLVSGDWYDAALLPSGQVLLAVGDIAGHGIDAVTGMVALRNCLRGLAVTRAGPANLLSWLNEVACHLAGTIGTAVCGLYDPARRTLRWARAGHLPPVLIRSGTARELAPVQGMLLGADPAARYDEATTSLRPHDALLMFTDGLIERRDQPIDDAVGSLLAAASRPVSDVKRYADHLMRLTAANTGDDACLLAIRVRLSRAPRGAHSPPPLGAAAPSASAARAACTASSTVSYRGRRLASPVIHSVLV